MQLAEGNRREKTRPLVRVGQQTDQRRRGFLRLGITENFRCLGANFGLAILQQRQECRDGLLRAGKLAEPPDAMQARN